MKPWSPARYRARFVQTGSGTRWSLFCRLFVFRRLGRQSAMHGVGIARVPNHGAWHRRSAKGHRPVTPMRPTERESFGLQGVVEVEPPTARTIVGGRVRGSAKWSDLIFRSSVSSETIDKKHGSDARDDPSCFSSANFSWFPLSLLRNVHIILWCTLKLVLMTQQNIKHA